MFKGSIVAIITPFKNGEIDYDKLVELVEFQINNGTNGIVPCGTTGESPTLNPKEHGKVIAAVVKTSNGRVPVIAGTGSNSTTEAIEYTQHAKNVGANGALIVTPYYNKPTQRGIYLHFKTIADTVDIPIILYNIEGRCGVNIETPIVAKLNQECKNIVGVKEASGSLDQMKDVRAACGDDFIILSGDDALTLPMMELGGSGVISVAANIVPQDVSSMINAFNAGNKEEANRINDKLKTLVSSLFLETNPTPVKKAAELLGLCSGEVRLPMCEMEEENVEKLKIALEKYGLLKAA